MKLKALFLAASALLVFPMNAATLAVNNLVAGPGDTLYADKDNALMNGGLVTMGYFGAGVNPTTIPELLAALGGYTLVTSGVPGTSSIFGAAPGYADSVLTAAPGGLVPASGGLFGRSIYSIVTDAASLGAATATSQFALVLIGTFKEDSPLENEYFSNPGAFGVQVKIGSIDTKITSTPAGPGTYGTLKMTAVPEPSAALLGAIGALGLLRRRRI